MATVNNPNDDQTLSVAFPWSRHVAFLTIAQLIKIDINKLSINDKLLASWA